MRKQTMFRNSCRVLVLLVLLTGFGGCSIHLFKTSTEPLKEFTLEGNSDQKLLLIPIRGTISNRSDEELFRHKPSMVQEVVSQLQKAQKDRNVKALLLEVESPGGSVTASDILFHEVQRYKQKSGAKVVTIMMGTAASGGYYVALASDRIVAHPMTVTGSVGTIFISPNVKGLMEKIGVQAEITKSAQYKDMGSPFREPLPEEKEMLQNMIEDLNARFLGLAKRRRSFTEEQYKSVATARIFTATQALEAGLIDSIGYMEDAVNEAKTLAGLPSDARLVVYRRTHYPNDNPYNTASMEGSGSSRGFFNLPLSGLLPETGFHYLWLPQD